MYISIQDCIDKDKCGNERISAITSQNQVEEELLDEIRKLLNNTKNVFSAIAMIKELNSKHAR